VLIELRPGKELEFYEEVKDIQGVEKSLTYMDIVHGPFDAVMIIEADLKTLDALIMKVRGLPQVVRTETLMNFEIFSWEELSGRI